jgi:hypothetical protein
MDKVYILNKTIEITDILINGQRESVVEFKQRSNKVFIHLEGTCKLPLNVSFEAFLVDELDNKIASFSPTHFDGSYYRLFPGVFNIEETIFFPDNLCNGLYYITINLSQMNVEQLITIPKCIRILHDKNYNHDLGIPFGKNYFGYYLLNLNNK